MIKAYYNFTLRNNIIVKREEHVKIYLVGFDEDNNWIIIVPYGTIYIHSEKT